MTRWLLASLLASAPFDVQAQAQPQAGDPIRTIVLLTQPQAASPQDYQAAEMAAEAWKALGLKVTVRPLPGQQFNQVVWYERQRWDTTRPYSTVAFWALRRRSRAMSPRTFMIAKLTVRTSADGSNADTIGIRWKF